MVNGLSLINDSTYAIAMSALYFLVLAWAMMVCLGSSRRSEHPPQRPQVMCVLALACRASVYLLYALDVGDQVALLIFEFIALFTQFLTLWAFTREMAKGRSNLTEEQFNSMQKFLYLLIPLFAFASILLCATSTKGGQLVGAGLIYGGFLSLALCLWWLLATSQPLPKIESIWASKYKYPAQLVTICVFAILFVHCTLSIKPEVDFHYVAEPIFRLLDLLFYYALLHPFSFGCPARLMKKSKNQVVIEPDPEDPAEASS